MIEDVKSTPSSPAEYANWLENMSDSDFWQCARTLAAQSTRPMQEHLSPLSLATETLAHVTCFLRDGATCVLPFSIIREILPTSQHISRLPDVPPWVIGILSWRGDTMVAIDLCAYILQKELPHPRERVILITKYEDIYLALCVFGIDEHSTAIDLSRVVSVLPPSVPTDEEQLHDLRGIVGTWEIEDNMAKKPLVLDIPLLFKDIMQRIESRDTHV